MKTVGIYKDGKEVQVAKLSKKNLALISYSQSDDVKLLYKSFLSKKDLVIGLDASDILIHSVDFPVDNEKAIQKGMAFQAKLITRLKETSSVQIPIYKKSQKKALLYSTTMGKISKTTAEYSSLQIQPKYLGCVPKALARFFSIYVKGYESGFLFHFGKSSIHCIHVQEGLPIKFYKIDRGIENFAQENTIDLEVLDETKKDAMSQQLFSLKKEISHIFLSFLEKADQKKIPILLTGNVDKLDNIEKFFFSDFQENIASFVDISPEIPKTHAIPIGLALDVLVKDEKSLQFYQKNAVLKNQAKAFGIKVFFLLAFCVFMNLAFFSFQNKKCQDYKTYLNHRFQKIVDKDEAYLDRSITFSENLDEKIHEFEEVLSNENRTFPFFLKVPNVSQSLQWLYTHPLKETFKIEHLHYQLESYPTIENLKEPYLAKITMELSFTTKGDEKKFYDALSKDTFIDFEKKYQWKKIDKKVQTSFYLK